LYLLEKTKDNVVDNYNNDETRVYSSYHSSQFDNVLLNEAIQKGIKDKEFIHYSLSLLKNAKFPIYKSKIIEHVQQLTNDKITIALFQTLSDSLEYKNIEQIRIFFRVIFQQKIHLLEQRTQRNLMLILLLQTKIKNHQHQITMIQFQMMLCENTSVINVVNLFLRGNIYIYIKSLKDNMFYVKILIVNVISRVQL
jgi:hypothetical protein